MPSSLIETVTRSISDKATANPIEALLAASWAFMFAHKAYIALILLI
jgi:hypothetical protein